MTLTVWDQEVRGGQRRQIEQLNAAFQAKLPERHDQARREVVHRPQHDAQARRVGRQGARRRAGQPGPPGDGSAGQGRPAAAARRLRRRVRLGRPLPAGAARPQPLLDRRRARSAPASCSGSRRWARSSASSTTATRCRGRRRRSATSSGAWRARRRDGEVPISFGNLDKWPGIHEFQTVQNAYAPPAAGARLRVRARGRVVRHAGEPRGGGQARRVGEGGLLHEELQRRRLRPGVAAVLQGRRAVPDRRHVAAARPLGRDGRQARLHADAAADGGRGGRGRWAARACRSRSPRSPPTRTSRRPTSTSSPTPTPPACWWRPATCRRCRRPRSRRAPPARRSSRPGARSRRATGWCRTSTTRRRASTTTSPPAVQRLLAGRQPPDEFTQGMQDDYEKFTGSS